MANPTLSDLKALAAALPPTERVSSSEVADVLSALIATVTHGRAILDAGLEGGNAVYAFIHDEIAKVAEQNGDPQPEKGQGLLTPPPTGVAAAAGGIDYDALATAMLKAQAKQQAAQEAAPVTQSSPADSEQGGNLL